MRPKTDFLCDSGEFFANVMDDLKNRQMHRTSFFNELQACRKVILETYTGVATVDDYVFLMRDLPIIVREVASGGGGDNIHPLYYSYDWSNAETIFIPYVGGSTDTLYAYFKQFYPAPNGRAREVWAYYPAPGGALYSFIPAFVYTAASAMARTIEELYDMYKAYYHYKSSNSHRDDYYASDSGAWSESNWPELVGVRTAYINNVGVFIPDYTDIDFNLSHSLGEDVVALRVVRAPNSGTEADKYNWDTFRGIMEFFGIGQAGAGVQASGYGTTSISAGREVSQGAGAAGAIIGTYNFGMNFGARSAEQLRLIYPRIRSFGRQVTPIPSYDGIVNIVKGKLGFDKWDIYDGSLVKQSYSKFVTIPKRETINAWINNIRPYVKVGTFDY